MANEKNSDLKGSEPITKLSNFSKKLILSALEIKRKDIVVKEFRKGRYADVWYVINKNKQEVFSFERETRFDYDDLCERVSYDVLTLTIANETFTYNYNPKSQSQTNWEMESFLSQIEDALKQKCDVQHQEYQLQEEVKKMSDRERRLKEFLEKSLQR